MSSILSLIEGYDTGNSWEELCVRCYRLRYQSHHYQAIPAVQGGDAGIEGFTDNGIVHQCYCPERQYDDQTYYEHLRDKLTADIDKLKKNASRLKGLGVPPITEWHFNIPEYRDARILSHVAKKQEELLSEKNTDPVAFEHIADSFKIYIKVAEDFEVEISKLLRTTVSDRNLNLTLTNPALSNWSDCDSEKVNNIRRKLKAVMHVADGDNDLEKVVRLYAESYLHGLHVLSDVQTNFPEIYEDLYAMESSFKRDVEIRTLMNTDRSMNQNVFSSILTEFQEKLERDFSKILNSASINMLKTDLIASWLADCSMEFKEAQA